MFHHSVMLALVYKVSQVSSSLLFTLDFGTTVPPLTEFIKNLLGKYTEGQILKVSEEQCHNLHLPHNTPLLCKHLDQVLSTSFHVKWCVL